MTGAQRDYERSKARALIVAQITGALAVEFANSISIRRGDFVSERVIEGRQLHYANITYHIASAAMQAWDELEANDI